MVWYPASPATTRSPRRDSSSMGASDHLRRNRALWDAWARSYVESGERRWGRDVPEWGIWNVPESQVGMLPDDLGGKDAIELGCGTAYVSAWLARRAARVVGLDNSDA